MYEYEILMTGAPIAPKEQLNSYGKDGWKLVTIVEFGNMWYYYFVRNSMETIQ